MLYLGSGVEFIDEFAFSSAGLTKIIYNGSYDEFMEIFVNNGYNDAFFFAAVEFKADAE